MISLKNRKVKLDEFTFFGFSVETSNQAEMSGEGVIPGLWEKFYSGGAPSHSPTIALYTNYESDENGTYTFAIGHKLSEDSTVPKGMKEFTVPNSNYVVFTTRKGPVQEVVVEAWQEIWEWSKENERTFTADFEVYDERTQDPNNSQVDIYIAVK